MLIVARGAHGELRHVEMTDLDRASRVQSRKHGRGVIGHKVSADF
jgi:hypothetical protein